MLRVANDLAVAREVARESGFVISGECTHQLPAQWKPGVCIAVPARMRAVVRRSQLEELLSAAPVASIRLTTSGASESDIRDSASDLKRAVEGLETSIFLENDFDLANALDLDGVHLSGGPRMVRAALEATGGALAVGAFCGRSMHKAMNAGEAGAAYVGFGPVSASASRPGGRPVEFELLRRWREITVVPVVAEGCLSPEDAGSIGNSTDFLSIGAEIWEFNDPVRKILAILGGLRNA